MKMANWVLPVLFSASLAQAGGWQSSGGERFKDAKNPWFLANTAQVNYCVRVDTATVSASEATVKRLIEEGFAYWKSEFSRTMTATVGATPIATQTFTEVPCSLGIADLEFLVGYGTLSSAPNNDQIGFLEVPEKYIGVTVRTDYDTVRLRGKGFIYIASDIGPHSYLGQESDLNALTLIPNAWKYDRLLGYAILHELGHVFGLPHTG